MRTALPTKRQVEYQDWEFGIFLHFGIRTFYEGHKDWDGKPMDPKQFNPTELDCGQWARTAKQAGVRYMVMTAKHHDGFANWPSQYTDFSVASSPWKGGRGDVVREFTDACSEHDLRVGLYYSPADWSRPEYDDENAYDEYFINQVSEILQPYGRIDMLWFDGCGSEGHTYDWQHIISEVRRMQPDILIFNMGDPDYRWIGNEAGIAPLPTWNTVGSVDFSIKTDEKEELAQGAQWLPAECDCMIRDHNWFYQDYDRDTVKSIDELVGLYCHSVGRGCNLLLNIGPDRRGLLPHKDAEHLLGMGEEIRRRFNTPLADISEFRKTDNTWEYIPEQPIRIDHVVVQEDIVKGEHIREFEIRIEPYTGSKPVTIYRGQNVGHKAICQFPLVRARRVLFAVTEAQGQVDLRELQIYCTTQP